MEHAERRKLMVRTQVASRDVVDEGVLRAMENVPRHAFVPFHLQDRVYDDGALSIGEGQTISQPYMVAKMTELLELSGKERVLEIGTGSGYQTAVLAELCREVFTVERISALSERARETLRSLGYDNINFLVGDGSLGWPGEAPFDRILITAGAPEIPRSLMEQLAEDGIIVIPVGDRMSQTLVKGVNWHERLKIERHTPCMFVPLVGDQGWNED